MENEQPTYCHSPHLASLIITLLASFRNSTSVQECRKCRKLSTSLLSLQNGETFWVEEGGENSI